MNAPLHAAALVYLVLHLPLAHGQAQPTGRSEKDLPPAELKRVYLACESAASISRLTMTDVMRCSKVAEELKQRVFDGDVDKLHAWWRANRPAVESGVPTMTTAVN
jgi:hypothetical protein